MKKKTLSLLLTIMISVSLGACSFSSTAEPSTSGEGGLPSTELASTSDLPSSSDMPTVTLAPDDGTIPSLESIEIASSEASQETQESQETGSGQIEATTLPTASTSEGHEEDESLEGSDPEILPTTTPGPTEAPSGTSTPSATQSPQATTTPSATGTPAATSTPSATQTPSPTHQPQESTQPTSIPQATETPAPQATETPSSSHTHEWSYRYVAGQDYLGNCQYKQHVVEKCYGCGLEETHDYIVTTHVVHGESQVLADVNATCTTPGYRDVWYHDWCDCGAKDETYTTHDETPAFGHIAGYQTYDDNVNEQGQVHWEIHCISCDMLMEEGWD